jgi:hypothetical protein
VARARFLDASRRATDLITTSGAPAARFHHYEELMAGPEAPLDVALSWAEKKGLPVYMGEFGADDVGDPRSRAVWTKTTRVAAGPRGFGGAYCDDGGRFQTLDRKTHVSVPHLQAARLA